MFDHDQSLLVASPYNQLRIYRHCLYLQRSRAWHRKSVYRVSHLRTVCRYSLCEWYYGPPWKVPIPCNCIIDTRSNRNNGDRWSMRCARRSMYLAQEFGFLCNKEFSLYLWRFCCYRHTSVYLRYLWASSQRNNCRWDHRAQTTMLTTFLNIAEAHSRSLYQWRMRLAERHHNLRRDRHRLFLPCL